MAHYRKTLVMAGFQYAPVPASGRPSTSLALVDRLVWIDCEMTGLDLEHDRLIEVACLVTDGELNVLDEGIDLVIGAPDEALDAMVPVVAEMHAGSGLTEAVRAATLSVSEAEQKLMDCLRERVRERLKGRW